MEYMNLYREYEKNKKKRQPGSTNISTERNSAVHDSVNKSHMDFYKKRIEDKTIELTRIKQKLNELQSEINQKGKPAKKKNCLPVQQHKRSKS